METTFSLAKHWKPSVREDTFNALPMALGEGGLYDYSGVVQARAGDWAVLEMIPCYAENDPLYLIRESAPQ